MPCDWTDQLIAILHDPPDKALNIGGHERRALRYLTTAAGLDLERSVLKGTEDQYASIAERLPMPHGREDGLRVGPEDGPIEIVHPLSAGHNILKSAGVDEEAVNRVIAEIVTGIDEPERRFLALWRLLPSRLAKLDPDYALLPADTRVPDHTIWHHLDTTAGLKAALGGVHGVCLLSFNLGPVQPFIEAARSVRDLWSGSMILSWLSFRAVLPVVEEFGPTAVIFPSLRGIPLMDRWLRQEHGLHAVPEPDPVQLRSPCLPNQFLAMVPWGPAGDDARSLAERCENAARGAWRDLTSKVQHKLAEFVRQDDVGGRFADWARDWSRQVDGYFAFTTSTLPLRACDDAKLAQLMGKGSFAEAYENQAKVRTLDDALPAKLRPAYDQQAVGRWQAQVDLSARLLQTQRAVRHVPESTPAGNVPPKCSLMGTFEQMGPPVLEESRAFWEFAETRFHIGKDRIRKRERFCAVSLAKRFAGSAYLLGELGLPSDQVQSIDTATVAAAEWLRDAKLEPPSTSRWNGQWLHWSRRDEDLDPDEEPVPEDTWRKIQDAKRKIQDAKTKRIKAPPAYYAILMMDGDNMGKWLAGELSPRIRDILHPKALAFYRGLNNTAAGLDAKRPLGPARHAAISEALSNFALHSVPKIVDAHHGTLIYAGGDDVLAMLPANEAIACAVELRLAFSGDPSVNGGARQGYYRIDDRDLLMMGPAATTSCGVVVVHHKEDLRFALQEARRAEKQAKHSGRDALQLAVCRRSGEHTSALCPWEFCDDIQCWITAFKAGATDRWAYRLRGDLETFKGLSDVGAMRSEIRRQIQRTELENRRLLAGGANAEAAADQVVAQFDKYVSQLSDGKRNCTRQQAMEDFVLLCQSASFLARGGADQ